jgi:uncharacterized protein YjbJ (UPF0337 family)
MNRDRVVGAAKTVAGTVKQTVGKAIGDQKTVAAGKAEIVNGKIQSAVGGLKDTIRNITKAR